MRETPSTKSFPEPAEPSSLIVAIASRASSLAEQVASGSGIDRIEIPIPFDTPTDPLVGS